MSDVYIAGTCTVCGERAVVDGRCMYCAGFQAGLQEAPKAMGRSGGRAGGVARAAKLSPERRREIAAQAATARWGARGTGGEP